MSDHTDNEKVLDRRLAERADVLMNTDQNPLIDESDSVIRDLGDTMIVFNKQARAIHSKISVKKGIYKSMRSAWTASLSEHSRQTAPTRSLTRISPVLRGFAYGLAGVLVVITALLGYAQLTGVTTIRLTATAAGSTTLLSISVLVLGGLIIFLLMHKDKK